MDMALQGDKSQEIITKHQAIEEQSLDFFDRFTRQVATVPELMAESGLSQKTVYNRINRGREIVDAQIKDVGPKFLADIHKKYEYIWEQAKTAFAATGNPLFLKQMASVLEAYRKMLSLDAPAKAPVNEKGKAVQDQLIFVFNDAEYKEKEEIMKSEQENAIEGEFTAENVDENSTVVLLTDEENGDNIDA